MEIRMEHFRFQQSLNFLGHHRQTHHSSQNYLDRHHRRRQQK
jgi:hypothetical protein